MLKVLGATAQNIVAQQAWRPGFVHLCILYYQLQRAYEFVTCYRFCKDYANARFETFNSMYRLRYGA
jgi:hypothetical protein